MKIFVEAKTNMEKEYVERLDATHFRIGVKVIPEKGKANMRIAKLLADFLGVSLMRVILRSGAASKTKCFDVS
jgi:uncharacterized protein YggU (UPF0235/DUF167 family)